ncbi:F-box/kelch-repeat protein [Striga hermonthica]|uniref:F-box/kelch-repeat protein n=1 Tax=Striga hermonthica TaxID=68872 RepID=A0A9N7NWE2_STRHE|nr:F-box/kelch-repeat protein [Striga hermonthica]
MDDQEFTDLIPGLPEELALECLTRLHYSAHGVSSSVCRRWRSLLQSTDFYYHRKQSGFTRKAACLVQSLPTQSESKPSGPPRYGLTLFDPAALSWERVDPVPKYPDGLPLFCQVVSTEGKLVLMGGWAPSSWEPVRDVFVYEFTTRAWTQCADMPSTRSFFAIGAFGGRVFVAGGHDESKNALSSAWVFDVKRNEWSELTRMSEERDECEGVVVGSEFWVVSGYGTETQGAFKSSAEVYDIGSGQWRRVEDAWRVSRCPRSSVGVANGNSLVCWAEADSAVRVGACVVDLGDPILVTGSAYQGAPIGFYLMEGQKGKLAKVEVPDEYAAGLVQSGCCVEI